MRGHNIYEYVVFFITVCYLYYIVFVMNLSRTKGESCVGKPLFEPNVLCICLLRITSGPRVKMSTVKVL